MKLFGYSPIDYFNRWFVDPIRVSGNESVESVIDALNRHPLSQDETSQDYVMPVRRYRERDGRFRILGENQDVWYCFVYDGDETLCDPPVYFETCLDLRLDHGFTDADIIADDHVMVCARFTDFLWQMLGHQICLRMDGNGLYTPGVHGVVFENPLSIDDSFVNPIGREFPAGFTCFISPVIICIPIWGAAFLDADSGRRFMARFKPVVSRRWA